MIPRSLFLFAGNCYSSLQENMDSPIDFCSSMNPNYTPTLCSVSKMHSMAFHAYDDNVLYLLTIKNFDFTWFKN